MIPQSPKGSAWLVIYRRPGRTAVIVKVKDYRHGLTAYEAWRASSVPVSFPEAVIVQLDPFPFPSVNTKERRNESKTRKQPLRLRSTGPKNVRRKTSSVAHGRA